jgi:hypothetical protein
MESFALHKLYKLQRMRIAIQRSIAAPTIDEKERAARWAAAWGAVAGIPRQAKNGRPSRTGTSHRTAK